MAELPKVNKVPIPKATNGVSLGKPRSGSYNLQKLRAIHHNIIRMSAQGMKQVEIAKRLGVSAMMINYTLNSDVGKKKMAVLLGEADMATLDVINEARDMSPLAMEVVEDLMMKGQKEETRLRAAETVLDRAGYGKRTIQDVNVNFTSSEEIQEARLEARKRGIAAGVVVEEAEFEVIEDSKTETPD